MYVKPKIVAYIGGFFVLYKTQSNHLLRLVSLLYEIHFYSKQVIKYYFEVQIAMTIFIVLFTSQYLMYRHQVPTLLNILHFTFKAF